MSKLVFDAVIILGGGISEQGDISTFTKQRVDLALTLDQKSTPLIMSGNYSALASYTPPTTEAAAMRTYALDHTPTGTELNIFCEEKSMDTIGNAYFTAKEFLVPWSARTVLVVTSDFHVLRTRYIFQKVLGDTIRVIVRGAGSELSEHDQAATRARETKLLSFTKQLLNPIVAGDLPAIRRILDLFPGYNSKPFYTVQQLRDMFIVEGANPYGQKQNTNAKRSSHDSA